MQAGLNQYANPFFWSVFVENHILISNQTEKPPEFKHITKGRKRK